MRRGFRFGKEGFFVLARKSRDCAEAYDCTPHKQDRRLTPPGRKSTLSGRKLINVARQAKRRPRLRRKHQVIGMARQIHVFLVMHFMAGRTGHVPGPVQGIRVEAVCDPDPPDVRGIHQVITGAHRPLSPHHCVPTTGLSHPGKRMVERLNESAARRAAAGGSPRRRAAQ